MSNMFIVQGAELPSRYCTRVLVKPQFDLPETRRALGKFFAAYELPRIDEWTWGYSDDSGVEIGDDKHRKITSATVALTRTHWANNCAEAVLTTDGTEDVEDLLAYGKYWDEAFEIVR